MLVLGVAYKRDVDDLRESPALDILDLLSQKGCIVSYHDPHVPEIRADDHTPEGAVGKSVPLTDAALTGADAVIVVTDHRSVDYARVSRLAKIVIDTRNATAAYRGAKARWQAIASFASCWWAAAGSASAISRRSRASRPQARGCMRRNRRAREGSGEKFSVPHFTSDEELLDKVKADVAVICTPSGLHPKHGIWRRSMDCT